MQSWHHDAMSRTDPQAIALPEVSSPDVTRAEVEVIDPKVAAAFESLVPLLVDPDTLAQGLRYLQQRIPGFVQLSLDEQRTMIRAAHLPPEFVDSGIDAVKSSDEAKEIAGKTGEELEARTDRTRRLERVLRELRALESGIEGAILREKHAIGLTLLDLYVFLGRAVKRKNSRLSHLRPYFEEMQRAYRKPLQKARKKSEEPTE